MNKIRFPSIKKPTIISLILVGFGIVIGFFLFKEFGASWDEPEYYEYADSIVHAYSIKDLLNGNYNLDSSLGHVDLRLYGPAYLLFGKLLFPIFKIVLPNARSIEIWHLLNYLFFLLGLYYFYKITLKLVSQLTAIFTTLLFATQPVLFGSSWINPKDIPFLVIFLGAIYFGLKSFGTLDNLQSSAAHSTPTNTVLAKKTSFKTIWFISAVFVLIITVSYSLGSVIINFIEQVINNVFQLNEHNLFRALFTFFAKRANPVNIADYAIKAASIFIRIRLILLLAGLSFFILLGISTVFPGRFRKFLLEAKGLFVATLKSLFTKNFGGFLTFLFACLLLGALISTRVVGPFAGFLLGFFAIAKYKKNAIPFLLIYAIISMLYALALWPYLWIHPVKNFLGVVQHMSDNPVIVNVLFSGKYYGSDSLPASYLPTLLLVTLTEIVPILFFIGLVIAAIHFSKEKESNRIFLSMVLMWFLIPLIYIVVTRPPLYDNYRHFLFITPPIFILAGLAIEKFFSCSKSYPFKIVLGILILVPGVIGIIRFHPYEYSYYNSYTGGIKGASGIFEMDYWNTCYKSLAEQIGNLPVQPKRIIVASTPNLVELYLPKTMAIEKMEEINYPSDSLILLHYRWDYLRLYPDYPVVISVKIEDTPICEGKLVP